MSAWILLSTFPGWPEVNEPSLWHMFMLCLGAPLLIGVLFTGLVLGSSRRKDAAAEQRAAGLVGDADRTALSAHRPQRALGESAAPVAQDADGSTAGGAHAAH